MLRLDHMNQYEITLITKENLKGEPAKKEIENLGGKIVNIQGLEERQFAYPIKKEASGFYTAMVFEIAPEKVMELNKKLALDTEILRHLIITYRAAKTTPTTPKLTKELAKPIETEITQPAPESLVEPRETEIVPVEKPEKEDKETPAPAKEKKPTAKKAKAPEKVKVEKPKPEKMVEKPKISKTSEEIQKDLSAEDRLKALDKKLDELLKE